MTTYKDDDELKRWLLSEDELSLLNRLVRLKWLVKEFGEQKEYIGFYGGLICKEAFEEARRSYLNGNYIATVVLCQIVLENSLHGIFVTIGRDDLEKASFRKLLKEAYESRLISDDEYDLFNEVRKLRNPYTHYRSPKNKEYLGARIIENGEIHFDIFEEDAKIALRAVFKLLGRYPFSV